MLNHDMLLCFLITCFEIFKNWQINHLEVNHLILKYLGNFVCLSVYCYCSVHCVRLFVTPWAAVHQASLSFTISWSLLKLMSFESVMPSNHLILCQPPSPPAFSLSQHQGLFQWVNSLHEVAKVLEFQLQHQSFQWTPRTDLL